MNLRSQKELAARALKVSKERIRFVIRSDEDLESLKGIVSREDVRDLFEKGVIKKLPKRGISRTRAKFIMRQKKKGRRRGYGTRRGTKNARFNSKRLWIIKIRALRRFLRRLRDEGRITRSIYRELYLKSKGNFFRNKGHLKLYLEQNNVLLDKNGKE